MNMPSRRTKGPLPDAALRVAGEEGDEGFSRSQWWGIRAATVRERVWRAKNLPLANARGSESCDVH